MPSVKRRVCEVIKKELTFKSVCARYSQVTSNLEYNQHFNNCRHRDRVCSIDPFPHLQRFVMINDNAPASPSLCRAAIALFSCIWSDGKSDSVLTRSETGHGSLQTK